ncbi:MAG: WecB/TagA/CpsF family glycosyltransferase [Prevotellaceae bacterium]|jgi:N-acetylglucosaminyldiphosphoundecaprenol N-acetyl-beta-D-mannosaminyltransferase|nr:WecB/TagA/CpsF family glycosyltransferase [Prevotellaceae bacterium]
MQKHPLFTLNLSIGSYRDFLEEIPALANSDECSEYICVANVHMLVETYRDKAFAEVVNNAAITTSDGLPLTWALRWLYGIRQERVAGMDLLPDLLSLASQRRLPVFFYGETDDVLCKIKNHTEEYYSGIPYTGIYSPPFHPLNVEEEREIINTINSAGAKLIFVALGCPKQEKWMAAMKGKINGVMIGIGGALPVLVGVRKRAPKWMQQIGLEWVYRLMQEPKRLFKRYLYTNTVFIFLVLWGKIKMKFSVSD